MDRVTIDQVLARLRKQLRLSKEAEYEVLAEIRTHLEDAVADAVAKGEDEQVALLKAAEKFGLEEAAEGLQQVHEGQDALEAIAATALPILLALVLRWLTFAPDGSAIGWPALLARPGFWLVAAIALVVPFIQFRRWRYALLGWAFFWLLTVIFIVFPSINTW
jgi:hypothetical protein